MENKSAPKWVTTTAHVISGALLFACCAGTLGLAIIAMKFLLKVLRAM